MAFLDKKTRIIDIQLTEHGRELMARNELRIAHYAFSDELIDYQFALSQSIAQSASLDEVVYREFVPLEADSMGGSGLPRDLSSFLYTAPEQRDALPQFKSNVSGATDLTRISKTYGFYQFLQEVQPKQSNNFDLVVITQRDDTTDADREVQYSAEQSLAKLEQEDPLLVSLIKT